MVTSETSEPRANVGSTHHSANQLFASRECSCSLTFTLMVVLEASMTRLSSIKGCHGYQPHGARSLARLKVTLHKVSASVAVTGSSQLCPHTQLSAYLNPHCHATIFSNSVHAKHHLLPQGGIYGSYYFPLYPSGRKLYSG